MDQMMPPSTMQSLPQPKKSRVFFAVIIIVALVVVAGVLYALRNQLSFIPQYGLELSNDDVAAIEQDLKATNLDDLGAELSDIEKELTQ